MKLPSIPASIEGWPRLKASVLLEHGVREELIAYRERQNANAGFIFLEEEALAHALQTGAVSFGESGTAATEIQETIILRNAREAFIDGVILMFVDGRRVRSLDDHLNLSMESKVRYLRLYAIRGT